MATWFTGTSTGNNYEVGTSYRGSNGDTFTANRDGSFTNERTGRASVGSSQSPDVTWSTNDREPEKPPLPPYLITDQGKRVDTRPAVDIGAGGGPGVGHDGVGGGAVTGVGGGGAGAAATAGPGNAAAATSGNRGAFLDQIAVSLSFDKPSKVMPLVVGGRLLAHDTGWSNIADWEDRTGESEFLSPTWFASWGVAGADAWANVSSENGGPIKTRKVQEDLYNAPGVLGGALRTIGQGFLDTRAAQRDPFGPDHPLPGFRAGGF